MATTMKTALALGIATTLVSVSAIAQEGGAADAPANDAPAASAATSSDEGMALQAGEAATVFESLTIEGEDRVRVSFERPALSVELDPLNVGGLEWMEPASVVDRVPVDLFAPYLAATSHHRVQHVARPWLMSFPDGPVARFRPDVTGVDRWQFIVADSRGQTVASFGGDGRPPKEIAWDGMTLDGSLAAPGLTYSHALEAYDKAGNKRSFVGEGFVLPAYMVAEGGRVAVLLPGSELTSLIATRGARAGVSPALILEAATRLNDAGRTESPVRITATARSFDQANALASAVAERMSHLLVGDPLRIQPVADVKPDSPVEGSVSIVVEG